MKEPKGSGTTRIYAELRERILNLELGPGDLLEEAVIEQMLGASRTPVREALIRLAAEGLVEQVPNRGARVAPIGIASLPQYFEALDLVQRAVTRWAAQRRRPGHVADIARTRDAFERAVASGSTAAMNNANTVFHDVIATAAGNQYLAQQYRLLLAEGVRLARLTLVYTAPDGAVPNDHLALIIADHHAMSDAIEVGNADASEALAASHAILFRSRVDLYLSQNLAPAVAITWAA